MVDVNPGAVEARGSVSAVVTCSIADWPPSSSLAPVLGITWRRRQVRDVLLGGSRRSSLTRTRPGGSDKGDEVAGEQSRRVVERDRDPVGWRGGP
jgi:hypothetical protein